MRNSITFNKTLYQLLGILLILFLWQVLSFVFGGFIVPQPLDTFKRLGQLLMTGGTYAHVGMTAFRVLSGFTVALLIGVPWGMTAGRYGKLEAFSDPIISLFKSVPVVSIIIIVLFFFGSKLMPSVISLLVVIPIVYTNTLTGVKNLDIKLIEMMKVYRVSRWQRIYAFYFKGILPYLFAGIEIGLGIAFKAVVAGEVISPPSKGIGASIWNAKLYIDLEGALAWTALALIFSFILELMIKVLREGAMPWKSQA